MVGFRSDDSNSAMNSESQPTDRSRSKSIRNLLGSRTWNITCALCLTKEKLNYLISFVFISNGNSKQQHKHNKYLFYRCWLSIAIFIEMLHVRSEQLNAEMIRADVTIWILDSNCILIFCSFKFIEHSKCNAYTEARLVSANLVKQMASIIYFYENC